MLQIAHALRGLSNRNTVHFDRDSPFCLNVHKLYFVCVKRVEIEGFVADGKQYIFNTHVLHVESQLECSF